MIKIVYAQDKYFTSFHKALSTVAQELIYLEMTEAPPLEKIAEVQSALIAQKGPVYYAICDEKVVGWCDIFPETNPRQSHRGNLGMGLIPEYRGQGLGSKLLAQVLDHAKTFGFEKVELHVYSSNTTAVKLYKKFGFEQEGLIRKFRKLNGQYFDYLAMGKFL